MESFKVPCFVPLKKSEQNTPEENFQVGRSTPGNFPDIAFMKETVSLLSLCYSLLHSLNPIELGDKQK